MRRAYKKARKKWEREYWNQVLEEAKEAQRKRDIGTMYQLLRKLGNMESKKAPPSEIFTAEEFRDFFSKVSETRNERTEEQRNETIALIKDLRNNPKAKEAAEKLDRKVTIEEVIKEWKEMKDGAPGKDGVTIKMIRNCHSSVQKALAKKIVEMSETHPDRWQECLKEGIVIPLHKKGPRNILGNYRGVCLLAMGSRILASVWASRLREWCEELNLLSDTQHGFRPGRSTGDAAQVMIRMNEEIGPGNETSGNMKVILLDIKKAYPRVNKGMLWEILKRYGIKENAMRNLKGLHEGTSFEVRGRDGNSTKWKPMRGLREGDASSPVLFNVYHSTAMEIAGERRKRSGHENPGIAWEWIPGNSLPPKDTTRASGNSTTETIRVTEILFADDTQLAGHD